jgi:hypothetical protein
MLTKLFRQDRPLALLLLLPLLLLLWPGIGPSGMPMSGGPWTRVPEGMPLYAPVRALFSGAPWLSFVLGVLLVFGLSHRLDSSANSAELFDRRNHMPALLLPLLLAFMPQGMVPGPAFLGAWAVLWALTRAWTAIGRMRLMAPLFDAGLLMGLAALFYLPFTFLVVVLWATLAVNRPFHWREYVLPLLGMAVVLFLGWGICHFIDPGLWDPLGSLRTPAAPATPLQLHWMYRLLLMVVLGILLVATVVTFYAVYARSVMRVKNMRASLLAFVFAMGLLALFAWWLDDHIPPVLVAMPAAVLLSFPFLQARRIAWVEAGVWALLALALWGRWVG